MNLSRRRIFGFIPAGVTAALIAPKVADAALKAEPKVTPDMDAGRLTKALSEFDNFTKVAPSSYDPNLGANPAPAPIARQAELEVRTKDYTQDQRLLRPEEIIKELFILTRDRLEFKPILVKEDLFVNPRLAKATIRHVHATHLNFCNGQLLMPMHAFRQTFLVPAAVQLSGKLNDMAQTLGLKAMRVVSIELPGGMDWSEKMTGEGFSMSLFRGYDIRVNRMLTSAHVLVYTPTILNPSRLPV